MDRFFDLAIIGGGINGCAIAADAAGRGLSVILIEKDDLASKTSSQSTKLIHGGLRYLEYYQFSMVRKALQEREILLKKAPYLIHPCSFVLPYEPSMRPLWILKAGLFLYDHLDCKNSLAKSQIIKARHQKAYFSPLKAHFEKGLLYSDCVTDDARLTIAQALEAKRLGAEIFNYTQVLEAREKQGLWRLRIEGPKGQSFAFSSRVLVNAAGAAASSLNQSLSIENPYEISLVKGSHIVLPKLYEGEQAYLLQHEDKRIFFVVPYHGFSLVGTTDVLVEEEANESKLQISEQETDYLLRGLNKYFKKNLQTKDVISAFSGLRSLPKIPHTAAQSLPRDYIYHFSGLPAPSLTIYSGKLTSHRQLAKKAVDALKPVFPKLKASKTLEAFLPGAEWQGMSYEAYASVAQEKHSWLDKNILGRFLTSYGTRTEELLTHCKGPEDLGEHFGHGLFQVEVDYLLAEEWAKTSADILWRRSKLGLNFQPAERSLLDAYLLRQSR